MSIIQAESNNIFASKIKSGCEFIYFSNKIGDFYINNSLKYSFGKNGIYKLEKTSEYFEKISEINVEFEVIKNYEELFKFIPLFKYICVEPDLESLIFSNFKVKYLKYEAYIQTLEGIRWQNIYKLKNRPYSNEFFAEIEILQSEKIAYQNEFPFLDYSYFKNHEFLEKIRNFNLQDLFKLLYGENPKFILENLATIYDYVEINHENEDSDICLIDPESAKYFENVLYIGSFFKKIPKGNYSKCVLFQPALKKYKKFEEKKIEIKNKDHQLYYDNDLLRLYAIENDAFSFKKNIYASLKKYVFQEIQKRVKKTNFDSNWMEYLKKSNVEMIKILYKTNEMIESIMKILENAVEINFLKNYDIEFNGKIIILSVSSKTNDEIYMHNKKIFEIKDKYEKIYLISLAKVQEVDVKKEFLLQKKEKFIFNNYADLFYWNIIDVII